MVNVNDEYLEFYILWLQTDQKHLENSKIRQEKSLIFFLSIEWEP